ncbi:MAG TPA: hypothetical protein VN495_01635, partial [Candidatus Paceibacterota bacterium]|nr:hypothetical protein [Candidatus Paceibacterota bacterium]
MESEENGNEHKLRLYAHIGQFSEEGLATARVRADGTWAHIHRDGSRAFAQSYGGVGPFKHGLASVYQGGSAWHIKADGSAAYQERYRYVGDFVEVGGKLLAWVVLDIDNYSRERAFHILPDGTPAYEARFNFTGDFQSNGLAQVR